MGDLDTAILRAEGAHDSDRASLSLRSRPNRPSRHRARSESCAPVAGGLQESRRMTFSLPASLFSGHGFFGQWFWLSHFWGKPVEWFRAEKLLPAPRHVGGWLMLNALWIFVGG